MSWWGGTRGLTAVRYGGSPTPTGHMTTRVTAIAVHEGPLASPQRPLDTIVGLRAYERVGTEGHSYYVYVYVCAHTLLLPVLV